MRRKSISSRSTSTLSRWRHKLRIRWHRTHKGPWIVGSLLVLAVTAISYSVYAIHVYQVERQELTCLTLNVYFEARGEPKAGQYAVAEVTMNRVASERYPDSVCGVVYQKNWDWIRGRYVSAFSWTEFDTWPSPKSEDWKQAWEIAEEVYYRRRPPTLQGALFFHSIYIKPSWSRGKPPVARIGNHVFYK